MKSIGARLALWYALAATGSLACLSVVGYFMLEKYLVHGLDILNASEFEQIKAHLGNDYVALSPEVIDTHIRETTEFASVLFFIDVHSKTAGTVFRSSNLHGQTIPDVPHEHIFEASIPGTGELRVQEFILGPFDVMVATPLGPVRNVMEGYAEICAALVALMLGVSAAIGFGLSRLALRPVRLIQATANRIGSNNLSARIPVADVRDEISNLARLLNQMFDRLEASFNETRRFTAEASHELKTPLSLMRLQAEKMLIEGGLTPPQEEAVQVQLEEIERLNKIVEELLFLSRAEAGAIALELFRQAPARFLQGFVQDARVLAEHAGLECACTHEGAGEVLFDAKRIRQVLLNLLTNAVKASPAGSGIEVASVLTEDLWRVSVTDAGPGVLPEQREQIFERFVRLGPAAGADDQGSGLGLPICRSILQLHGGRIFADGGAGGRGLRVIFEIPLTGRGPAESATA